MGKKKAFIKQRQKRVSKRKLFPAGQTSRAIRGAGREERRERERTRGGGLVRRSGKRRRRRRRRRESRFLLELVVVVDGSSGAGRNHSSMVDASVVAEAVVRAVKLKTELALPSCLWAAPGGRGRQ